MKLPKVGYKLIPLYSPRTDSPGLIHDLNRPEIPIKGKVTLGKSAINNVAFRENPGVSHFHAEMKVTDDGLEITDLRSTNGTYVANQRIQGRAILHDGEIVRFANVSFEVATVQGGSADDAIVSVDRTVPNMAVTSLSPKPIK